MPKLSESVIMYQNRRTLQLYQIFSRSFYCFIFVRVPPFCLLLQLLNSSLPCQVFGFNLETRLPIVKYSSETDSYFGYSVAAHVIGENNYENNTKCILVGAPLGKNLQPGTNHSGALYRCPITQEFDDCEQIITDGRRTSGGAYESTYEEVDLTKPLDDEIKEGQWLGVTVRSQGVNGKVLVCAHRYVTKKMENRYGQGLCYVLNNDLNTDDAYEPCKGRTVARIHEDYAFCQVGTSGALLDDDTMVLGSPGPFTWRGTVFVTEIGGEYLQRDKNIYYSDHSDTSSPVDKYSYLGMAVTGGRYFGERMSYAAGAPRSNGHGQVLIFNKANISPMPVQMIIEGEQFASSFGYELTTADVNGDKKPDLIIAAPFYFTKDEGGAVYIYQNERDSLPSKPTLKLTGAIESRFGLALANIGDINKDDREDIAIGAPYEGNGVVYIYLGSADGLSDKPSQKIHSSDLGLTPKPIKTFGISIAGGIDLDGNSYPDVVVGAYNTSAAVVLLSRPIISIQTEYHSKELRNIDPTKQGCVNDVSTNLTCFSFEACCSIDPYVESNSNKDLRLLYTVEAETFAKNKKFSRVFFDRENKRSNVIKRQVVVKTNGIMSCQLIIGYIKENTKDIQSPIKFRLNYTIVEPKLPVSGLINLNPILDRTQSDIEFEGTFQKDCGDDDICESNLKLHAELDLNIEDKNYALILGEEEEIRLKINISNSADSAYESHLFVVHQKSVSFVAASKTNNAICSAFNETIVTCSLGNPMRRGTVIQLTMRFDPSGLENDETNLAFNVFANTTSKLIGEKKPEAQLDLKVVKRVDLALQGWATPEQNFYSGQVEQDHSKVMEMDSIGSQITHTYQIYNGGPWRAPKVVFTINWPHQIFGESDKTDKWLLYLEEMPFVAEMPDSLCFVAKEHINPLKLATKTKTNSTTLDNLLSHPASYMMRPKNKTNFYSRSLDSEKSSFLRSEKISSEPLLNRFRRDMISRIIRPERFQDNRDKQDKKREIVELDCNRGTASCIKIRCEILNMPANQEVDIQVKARLWNSTLVSEYPRADLVKILSTASVKVPSEYGVEQISLNDHITVETRAYPELLDQQTESFLPLWAFILIAIVVGLILLAIVAACLYKSGFFKRKRFDPTLSGNLEKIKEKKPFLKSNKKQNGC